MKHKTILAIDPGNEKSGFVIVKGLKVIDAVKDLNNNIMETVKDGIYDILVCEMIACYGIAVGKTVFDTCVWIGRFLQVAELKRHITAVVFKKTDQVEKGIEGINNYICKNSRANDANIRQAIIDLYPATGGGKLPQVGIKSKPGPLYNISGDVWSALAVALTYQGSAEYKRMCEK